MVYQCQPDTRGSELQPENLGQERRINPGSRPDSLTHSSMLVPTRAHITHLTVKQVSYTRITKHREDHKVNTDPSIPVIPALDQEFKVTVDTHSGPFLQNKIDVDKFTKSS